MRKRSRYRPRPVLKPLGMKDFQRLELPGRVGLVALGTDWLDVSHLRDIGCHAALVDRVARVVGDEEVRRAARVVLSIAAESDDRYQRTGKAGVTGDQLHQLREIVPQTMAWLADQKNSVIYAESLALLRSLDGNGAMEVGDAA